ncbi:sortilin-like [Rhopilema esculentum]|uniref:sortilin-like n=1 Tax=Rhopilema esculentum TaxID=499914 RepID=UPI0031D5F67C
MITGLLHHSILLSIFTTITILNGCSSNEAGRGQNILKRIDFSKSDSGRFSGLLKRIRKNAQVCPNLTGKPKRHQHFLNKDANTNIKLFWIGEQFKTQLLLTTFQMRIFVFRVRKQSKLYISNDDGEIFNPVGGKLKDVDIRTTFGVVKSERNPLKVILIGFSRSLQSSTLYISVDGAKKWNAVSIPFRVRQDEPIIPHPSKEEWLLALEDGPSMAVWLSIDFGFNWMKMKDQAYSVKWGAVTGRDADERVIFVTVKESMAGIFVGHESALWRSKDLGKSFSLLHDHVYSLGIQGVFLFISVDLDKKAGLRVMHVSKNNGDVFHRVHVPEVTPERFYAILDMSEGQIFLHVDEPSDTGKGTLFVSDADGIMYSQSLENHFYTNDGITDFFRVESMRGVFLTHQLQEGNTLNSLITFDRGATWNALYLADEQCRGAISKKDSKCSLHYHHTFSQQKGHLVQGPLSSASALGIIMLHGVPGDALHTNNTSVYLSRNGGYNWTKVLDGPHHYAIGDHGNLIVAVPRDFQSNITGKYLQYSLDQGRCWNTFKFTDDPMMIRGLVTEPNSKKRTFSIWGVIEGDKEKTWQVVTVNFEDILTRRCNIGDYEYWSPHAIGRKDGCFLGTKEAYPRVKPEVFCYSGDDYKPKITKEHCVCTLRDLECDYGFIKDDAGKCFRDGSVKLEICRTGSEQKVEEGKGYRRIPGDRCKGGKDALVQKMINYIDTRVPCKSEELESYGLSHQVEAKRSRKGANSKGFLVFGIILIILVLVGAVILIARKFISSQNSFASFRYSQLSSNESDELIEEVNGYDPRPRGVRPYQDESDFESDAEMLKL